MMTRNLRRLMCCLLICAGALFQAATSRAGEEQAPTARHVFALLPLSIFENTTTGLDETGRQALLQQGSSQSWEIAGETQDVLVLAELPFRERAVAVRLFRNEEDASTEVAIGTLGEPVCTVELWHLEGSGRLYPVDTPPEPSIGEFFSKKRKPPLSQQNSVLICLGLGGLWARPVFWSEYGIHEPVVDRQISFQWNGHSFDKVVEARSTKQAQK